jgi:hypothetical protein
VGHTGKYLLGVAAATGPPRPPGHLGGLKKVIDYHANQSGKEEAVLRSSRTGRSMGCCVREMVRNG